MNRCIVPAACGEILESSLNQVRCHIWNHAQMPSYGSLMVIEMGSAKLYGIVAASGRGPRDATRTPHPYQKTEGELLRDHPHIFEFIVSWCTIFCIGYEQRGILMHIPPPVPPSIHTFVRPAGREEQELIIASPHFVHRLFAAGADQGIAPEELLLPFLKDIDPQSTPYRAIITELSLIIGSDYRRFKIIINRLTASNHTHPA